MSQRNSALAALPTPRPPRYDTRHDDECVVVARGLDVPAWVVESCLRSGRQIRIEPAAATPEDTIRSLTALAGHSILLTGPADHAGSTHPGPRRVVAAVRDLPSDAQVLAEAAVAAEQLDAEIVPVHAVPLSFGERSVGLAEALARGHGVLSAAVERLAADAPGRTVTARLLRLRPYELVGEGLDAELLVLGGPRPRIPARIGLVGCSAVQHAPCPVLLAARPA